MWRGVLVRHDSQICLHHFSFLRICARDSDCTLDHKHDDPGVSNGYWEGWAQSREHKVPHPWRDHLGALELHLAIASKPNHPPCKEYGGWGSLANQYRICFGYSRWSFLEFSQTRELLDVTIESSKEHGAPLN